MGGGDGVEGGDGDGYADHGRSHRIAVKALTSPNAPLALPRRARACEGGPGVVGRLQTPIVAKHQVRQIAGEKGKRGS